MDPAELDEAGVVLLLAQQMGEREGGAVELKSRPWGCTMQPLRWRGLHSRWRWQAWSRTCDLSRG